VLFSLHGEFTADSILCINDIPVEVFDLEGLDRRAGGGGHCGELFYEDGVEGLAGWNRAFMNDDCSKVLSPV